MKTLIFTILLFPAVAAAEPSIFLVAEGDTLRTHIIQDSTFVQGELAEIDTTFKSDTLFTSATVGDTLHVEFHAVDWPEVIGYKIEVGHQSRSKGSTTFEPGDFYNASELPTTQSGIVDVGTVFEIGQVSLGESTGEGSGRLGTMVAVFNRSGRGSFTVLSAEFTTRDAQQDSLTKTELLGGMIVIFEIDPQEITVTADLDRDGIVSFDDFLGFVNHYGTRRGDERYDNTLDFDDDGVIGFDDFLLLAEDFGKPSRTYRTISRG